MSVAKKCDLCNKFYDPYVYKEELGCIYSTTSNIEPSIYIKFGIYKPDGINLIDTCRECTSRHLKMLCQSYSDHPRD